MRGGCLLVEGFSRFLRLTVFGFGFSGLCQAFRGLGLRASVVSSFHPDVSAPESCHPKTRARPAW